MFARSKYPRREDVTLDPGDVVVLLTDGITELPDRSDELLGHEAVLEVIRAHLHEPARRLVDRVYEAAEEYARGRALADDITIVLARRSL